MLRCMYRGRKEGWGLLRVRMRNYKACEFGVFALYELKAPKKATQDRFSTEAQDGAAAHE